MKLTKEEACEELSHQTQVVKALHARRRVLELQTAQQGSHTLAHIVTELAALIEEIRRHEDEISKLELSTIDDLLSLVEVEYRALLAATWDTPERHPTVADAARLELARLRLGISRERARDLEEEIRTALVRERLSVQ